MQRKTLVAVVAIGMLAACGGKKKDAGGGSGSGSGSGSDTTMTAGSGAGSAAGSGSGSGSGAGSAAGSGSDAAAGSGSGSDAKPDPFTVLVIDKTNGNREADLKTAADKAVAELPADMKDGTFGISVTLNKLDTTPKYDCSLSVDIWTMPEKNLVADIHGGATVNVEKGKEAGADVDCFEAVLEDLIVKKASKVIADKKAGKLDAGSGSGSAAGSGSGSAAGSAKK